MKSFAYKETLGKDHIRIIELLPGTRDDKIQCYLTSELRQSTIDSYDAISYAWGDRTHLVEIICCNEILSVTTNLADALREIRSKNPNTSSRLWVDAISINQGNSEEKKHQVKQLGQVYENARQVFAWLGRDQDGIAQDCFDILKGWNLYLDELFDAYKHSQNIPSLEPPRHLCINAGERSKLTRLMSSPWFSRVWVLQEAGLAKVCHLLWGDQSMSLAELVEFACFCDGRSNITRLIGGEELTFPFWRLVFLCVYRTYDNAESWRCHKPLIRSLDKKHRDRPGLFLDILQIGKSLSATDSRDHIYAFLGNPRAYSTDGELMLEPDYERAERDVYFDAACALLKNTHESPYVLSFVQHASADEVTGSIGSSWIPRWHKPERSPSPSFTIGNIGLSFRTGGSADRLQYRVHSRFGAERLLSIQGFVFDHLAWTSEPLNAENFALNPAQWAAELRTSGQTYIEMLWSDVLFASKQWSGPMEVPESVPALKSTAFEDKFTYTLVTGYNNTHVVHRKEHRKRFKAYLRALKNAVCLEGSSDASLSENQACDASRYEIQTRNCKNRRLALTKNGLFALVPQFAQPGDVCCVFLGMTTPFIIRKSGIRADTKSEYYHLVGEAYVHGVMQGELLDRLEQGDVEKKELILM